MIINLPLVQWIGGAAALGVCGVLLGTNLPGNRNGPGECSVSSGGGGRHFAALRCPLDGSDHASSWFWL